MRSAITLDWKVAGGFNARQLVTSVYEVGVPDEMGVDWILAVRQTRCNPVAVLTMALI